MRWNLNVLRLVVIIPEQMAAVIVISIREVPMITHINTQVRHQVAIRRALFPQVVLRVRQQLITIHQKARKLLHRVDAEEKALGTGQYSDDIYMDGDYDYDRYDSDDDYASGVDDAMEDAWEEYGEDW